MAPQQCLFPVTRTCASPHTGQGGLQEGLQILVMGRLPSAVWWALSHELFKVVHKYTDSLEASKPDLQLTAVKTVTSNHCLG